MDKTTLNYYSSSFKGEKKNLPVDDIQIRYILKYISGDQTISVLDAGCGDGRFGDKLISLGYCNTFGVDLLRHRIPSIMNYCCASIDKLPFHAESFDFIIANSVIYYLDNYEKLIKEFSRVLRYGGRVYISAHTKFSPFTLKRRVQRYFGMRRVIHLKNVTFRSSKFYKELSSRNGFEILLADGFQISFIIVPLYQFISRYCLKIFNLRLPNHPYRISSSPTMSNLKSIFSYHSILIFQKKQISAGK